MAELLGNLVFEGALFGMTALLLWAGYWSLRKRREYRRSERVEFIRSLVKMLEDMIPPDQGDGFDAARWVGRWLETPQSALAGAAPKEYLSTVEGRAIIKRLLGTIESGTYV